jgi:thioredoxin 1
MSAKNVTTSTFQADVLSSDKPVVVDFWAEWCGPCRAVSPILDEIASEHADKITVVKVNVDEEPGLAQQYGITSIPAMYVFQNAEVSKVIIGAKPKPALLEDLKSFIA